MSVLIKKFIGKQNGNVVIENDNGAMSLHRSKFEIGHDNTKIKIFLTSPIYLPDASAENNLQRVQEFWTDQNECLSPSANSLDQLFDKMINEID